MEEIEVLLRKIGRSGQRNSNSWSTFFLISLSAFLTPFVMNRFYGGKVSLLSIEWWAWVMAIASILILWSIVIFSYVRKSQLNHEFYNKAKQFPVLPILELAKSNEEMSVMIDFLDRRLSSDYDPECHWYRSQLWNRSYRDVIRTHPNQSDMLTGSLIHEYDTRVHQSGIPKVVKFAYCSFIGFMLLSAIGSIRAPFATLYGIPLGLVIMFVSQGFAIFIPVIVFGRMRKRFAQSISSDFLDRLSKMESLSIQKWLGSSHYFNSEIEVIFYGKEKLQQL